MEFQTNCTGKKRQMILFPEANPNSFVLFYEKGSSGYSWSIRDYSVANEVVERYATDFGCHASDVHLKATYSFDAPTHPTTDLAFWYNYTRQGNAKFLKKSNVLDQEQNQAPVTVPFVESAHFPILNLSTLKELPKATKSKDMDRILFSANSDWLTWNLFNLLLSECPRDWYLRIVDAAKHENPTLGCSMSERDDPKLEFWRRVNSPRAYEQTSRERMRQSTNRALMLRSHDVKPVEGASEIDVVLSTTRHLIFVEAKLGSDISMRTTYDERRNQIIRNIDCLLELTGERQPFFWMAVPDLDPHRVYYQLVHQYRENSDLVARALPHRDWRQVEEVCKSIAFIVWECLEFNVSKPPTNDPNIEAVKMEVRRRINLFAHSA